jgi:hypothetical protein
MNEAGLYLILVYLLRATLVTRSYNQSVDRAVSENNLQTSTNGPLQGRAGYLVLVCYWFARLCVRANGNWRFILSYGRSNGNWLAAFRSPPLSYIARNFCKPISLLSTFFHSGFLLGLFFDAEDGGDMFLRDVG